MVELHKDGLFQKLKFLKTDLNVFWPRLKKVLSSVKTVIFFYMKVIFSYTIEQRTLDTNAGQQLS